MLKMDLHRSEILTEQLIKDGYNIFSYIDINSRLGIVEFSMPRRERSWVLWLVFYSIMAIILRFTKNQPTVILDIQRFYNLDRYLTSALESAGYRVLSRSNKNLWLYNRLIEVYFHRSSKYLYSQAHVQAKGIPSIERYFKNLSLKLLVTQDTHSVRGRVIGSSVNCPIVEFQHGYLQNKEAITAFPLLADISFQWCQEHARILNVLAKKFNVPTIYRSVGFFGDTIKNSSSERRVLFILSERFDLNDVLNHIENLDNSIGPVYFRLHPKSKNRSNAILRKGLLLDTFSDICVSISKSYYVLGQPSSALLLAYYNNINCSQVLDESSSHLSAIDEIPIFPNKGCVRADIKSNYKEIWKIIKAELL